MTTTRTNAKSSTFHTGMIMSPIIDTNTKNRSFVKVARQLEILGIKNCSFHLVLLNPMLQGVDPHSKNLTPEQIMMITTECQLNIFYYLREVVRIPVQGGTTQSFIMDRGTLAMLYCFINDISSYLMKPRQTGKSVGIDAALSWAFKFGITNGDFMFVANDVKIAKKNLKTMKFILSNLPSYLSNMGTESVDNSGKKIRRTNNITSYTEPVTNNSASVANTAISEEGAEQIGRGLSQTHQFFDEAEFTRFIDVIVKVSGMSFSTAANNALQRGAHACRIFATTPGDLSSKNTCQSAMKIVNDSLKWSEKFYDISPVKFKEIVEQKSKFRVVYIEYDYKQLGLGEKWFAYACSTVGEDPNKIRREILLQRFSGNNKSPFTENDINELNEGVKTPLFTKTIGQIYNILFYEKPRRKRLYFLSIDPSTGVGGDNYAITVLDPYTLNTVAEFRSEYMTTDGCFDLVSWMVSKYFNNVMIIIERNMGMPLIDRFLSSNLKDRVYSTDDSVDTNKFVKEDLDEYGYIKDELAKRRFYGINTVHSNREIMMNILMDAVRFSKSIVRSKYVVDDISKLVVKNNKIQADVGEHDDSVMSWLLALYVYYYGTKLERYGFTPNSIPADVAEDDEFEKLQKLYNNPEIKKQFPSMYNFYMSSIKGKLNTEHAARVDKYVAQSEFHRIGGIRDMIKSTNADDDTIIEQDSSTTDDMKMRILQRWHNLNR